MRLSIRGADRIRETARLCRAAGRSDLPREMTAAVRRAARPTLADVRASARAIPVRGVAGAGARRRLSPAGSNGLPRLRAEVARSVDASVRAGLSPQVSIESKPGRMSPGRQKLPRHLDNPAGWRHPVYGNRRAWARQVGAPWFWAPIKKRLPTFRNEIDQAITNVIQKIERS